MVTEAITHNNFSRLFFTSAVFEPSGTAFVYTLQQILSHLMFFHHCDLLYGGFLTIGDFLQLLETNL